MKKITLLFIIALFIALPIYGIAINAGSFMQEQQKDQSAEESAIRNGNQNAQDISTEAVRVEIKQNAFHPAEIRIQPGTTVTWYNFDSVSHTITSGNRDEGNIARLCYPWEELVNNKIIAFDSGTLKPDQKYIITFEDPGEFPYFSRFHSEMAGKVIVSE